VVTPAGTDGGGSRGRAGELIGDAAKALQAKGID
jgi:hypothetical protein